MLMLRWYGCSGLLGLFAFQPFAGRLLLIGNLNAEWCSMRAWIIASLAVPGVIAAQQDPPPSAPPPTNLSRADEIRYARSAAPEDISRGAKIWVLESGRYRVAEQGIGAVACMVLRSTATSFEPQCGDMEADETVLAIDRFRTEQRIAGKTKDAIKAEVDDCLASGRFRSPTRPALVYMLSSSQVLVDSKGNASRFMPHLMIYYPGMKNDAMGLIASKSVDIPGVAREGTPLSALIVIARDWVDPAKTP
jgi:hypothetical protein